LDYFKDLTCFKSMAWGHSVSDEERDMMTDLLRRVREMTDEIGRQRGRPLLIAARVRSMYWRLLLLATINWLAFTPCGGWA